MITHESVAGPRHRDATAASAEHRPSATRQSRLLRDTKQRKSNKKGGFTQEFQNMPGLHNKTLDGRMLVMTIVCESMNIAVATVSAIALASLVTSATRAV